MTQLKTKPIIVEQVIEAPLADVWSAISSWPLMRQWFFAEIASFEAVVGFQTEFNVECEGQHFLHQWKVLTVRKEKEISYSWRYNGIEGDSKVTWTLTEIPAGVKLVLTHQGHESFPQDNVIFSRESGEGGWRYFVQESLPRFLANTF